MRLRGLDYYTTQKPPFSIADGGGRPEVFTSVGFGGGLGGRTQDQERLGALQALHDVVEPFCPHRPIEVVRAVGAVLVVGVAWDVHYTSSLICFLHLIQTMIRK